MKVIDLTNNQGGKMTTAILRVINRLEAMSKQGVSYDDKGRHGWRNPIRGDTGVLLQALVMAKNPKRVLEIGTAHGLSGCYLASEFTDGAKMVSIEWDESTAKEAQANFDEAGLPVKVMCGDAVGAITVLATGEDKFDLVFLDANKDGYLEQFSKLQDLDLLSDGALIVADNVIDRASEMAVFLTHMDRLGAVTINTECGLLVARI